MSYRIELESRARHEFLSLPAETRERIQEAIGDVGRNPRPPGAKRLVGKDGYRVRTGSDRVLYTIDGRNRLVRIYRIGHRGDAYRKRG